MSFTGANKAIDAKEANNALIMLSLGTVVIMLTIGTQRGRPGR